MPPQRAPRGREREQNAQWKANHQLLLEYVHEHQKLPTDRAKFRGTSLGKWCTSQRRAYWGKGTAAMTSEQAAALEAVPGWWWAQDAEAQWKANYDLLIEFVHRYKHLPKTTTRYKGFKLGGWCNNQRQAHKNRGNGKMTPERAAALEAVLGWYWDYDTQWKTNCQILLEFVHKFHQLPTTKTIYRDFNLGIWCATQHRAYNGQDGLKMTPERIAALEAVPGWKWKKERSF